MYTVSSEIYKETNFQTVKCADGKLVSKFKFQYPTASSEDDENEGVQSHTTVDKDGDLIVRRKGSRTAVIEIEHSAATEIRLVGLQVWRGALLLADYIFHRRADFQDKQVMELGAGVGLTSIAAAIYARQVVCTDVDIGGILNLIRGNVDRNRSLFRGQVQVLEYDFLQSSQDYSAALVEAIDGSDLVVAADVIYDDDLTDAFIRVIDYMFKREIVTGRKKEIYVALEKRFVFTLSELDAVAPMFEYFLRQTLSKPWHFDYISLDFPQYFDYERCKHLVLLKLTSGQIVK